MEQKIDDARQEHEGLNDGTDAGSERFYDADESLRNQGDDFLRGSRGDDPPSALRSSHGDEKASQVEQTPPVSTMTEQPAAPQVPGGGAEGESVHKLPHREVPQPGQFTDMDAVAELVDLKEDLAS